MAKEEKIKENKLEKPEETVEQTVNRILDERLKNFETTDRYTFQKHLQLFDGRSIQVGRGTGTKIGTEGGPTGQKLGLYDTTPVVQGTAISTPIVSTVSGTDDDATINANFGTLKTAIDSLRTALANIGITS